MGSHSVTCHPTQVNAPRLTPAMQAGTWFTYPGGMKAWVDLVDLIAPRPGVEPVTFQSRVQRPTAAPPRQHKHWWSCDQDLKQYTGLLFWPGEYWTGNISGCDADAVTTEHVVTVSEAPTGHRETPPVTAAILNPSRHSPTSASQKDDSSRESSTQHKPRPQAVELVSRQQSRTTVVGQTSI